MQEQSPLEAPGGRPLPPRLELLDLSDESSGTCLETSSTSHASRVLLLKPNFSRFGARLFKWQPRCVPGKEDVNMH